MSSGLRHLCGLLGLCGFLVSGIGAEVSVSGAEVRAGAANRSTVAALAAHDFLLHCAGCHGQDGEGSPAVPALDDLAVFAVSKGGREYLLRVPGVSQAPLSDARLAALMNWVVGRFGAVESFVPFVRRDVSAARAQPPLRDPIAVRDSLQPN